MNLLAGLEKFGLKADGNLDITKDPSSPKKQDQKAQKAVEKVPEEEDFLLEKTVTCPVCDRKFHTLTVKTGKAKRQEPDDDLRPNFQGIDIVKYDVASCPFCGYSALNKEYVHVSTTQIKWIREAVSENFKPGRDISKSKYTYDEAVDRFKLALVCAMAKRAKLSEKSYICLKIAWLRRKQLTLLPEGTPEEKAKKKEMQEEMDGFYKQAYEGFMKASSQETGPYCGIDGSTLEFMLANMAMYLKDYASASRLVSRLLTGNANPRVKDKCFDLKNQIVEEVKKQKLQKAKAAAAAQKGQAGTAAAAKTAGAAAAKPAGTAAAKKTATPTGTAAAKKAPVRK